MPGRSWNGTRGKVSGCSLGASDELTNNRKPPEMSGLLFILKLGHNQDHKNPFMVYLIQRGVISFFHFSPSDFAIFPDKKVMEQ